MLDLKDKTLSRAYAHSRLYILWTPTVECEVRVGKGVPLTVSYFEPVTLLVISDPSHYVSLSVYNLAAVRKYAIAV